MSNATDVLKLLLFGTTAPSADYNLHIRAPAAPSPTKHFNMLDYLTTGGGRFALPSLSSAVEKFFAASAAALPDGTYSWAQLKAQLSLTDTDLRFNVSQYGSGIGSADHAERAFIFGNSPFALADTMTFIVSSGVKSITNLAVVARPDNFDFVSTPGSFVNLLNTVLSHDIDPYNLAGGTLVNLAFDGPGRTYATYTHAQFLLDTGTEATINQGDISGIANLAVSSAAHTFYSALDDEAFLSFRKDGMLVVYGTSGSDNMTPASENVSTPLDVLPRYYMVGGAGGDTILGGVRGDHLLGGIGNDTLDGDLGDDLLNGGKGDDTLRGGTLLGASSVGGTDTAVFGGRLADYEILFYEDGRIQVRDKISNRDGLDTLFDVEFGRFAGKNVDLSPGQDLAFVIDTTGSMFDDIAQVKASATTIINSIFSETSSYLNTRIGIVGFKDPGEISSILSFTSQASIEQRKSAALSAISNISVGGGGDTPEGVYSGLLAALSGSIGEWREEARSRKILLFGDAPPNDFHLKAQVLALAADLSVDTPAPIVVTQSLAGGAYKTTITMGAAAGEEPFSVEIFTIVVGNNASAVSAFNEISAATGGRAFNPANASEVVAAILAAVDPTPTGAPTDIKLSVTGVNENAKAGSLVGTVSVVDPDAKDTHVLTLVDDGGGLFTLSGKLLKVAAGAVIDFEATTSLSVKIRATDAAGNAFEKTISIAVRDILETFGGTARNDKITGDAGANTINGAGGNDILNGAAGNDIITGGDGADRFVLSSGSDRITDFMTYREATTPIDVAWLKVVVARPSDRLDVSGHGLNFQSFLNGATQVGDDVVWSINSATSLTLEDVNKADFQARDFIF